MKVLFKIYQIFKIVFFTLIISLILFLSYYIIRRLIDQDKPSKIFGMYVIEVAQGSGSMYNEDPKFAGISLSPGDLLFVRSLQNSEYEVGMTISFYDKDGVLITHQIIEMNDETLITKGINKENSPDEPITYDMILGKVQNVWRGFRSKINFFISPLGIILFIIIILGINFGLNMLDKYFNKFKVQKK